jgi:hypothetical protein
MNRSISAALCAFLFATASAVARADEAIERARTDYRFSEWPGASAPARDGLEIEKLGVPGLVGLSARLEPVAGAPVFTAGLARAGRPEIEVLLQVWVERETAAAREALLVFLSTCERRLEPLAAPGDVAFGLPAGTEKERGAAIVAFARGNVAAVVRWVGRGAPEARIEEVAAAVDALALESPPLGAGREPTAVEVIRFEPRPAGAHRGSVPLALETRGRVAAESFRAGAGSVERSAGGLIFRPAAPGRARIEAWLVSPRGFRTRAEVEVEPPR